VVSTPYHGWLKNVALAASGKLDAHHEALRAGGHIKFFSRRTLERLLVDAGFREPRFIGTGRIPLVWKSMILSATRPS
jgi:2-polyprenyl-6-hydroxyphenyl methylase/3-demethylubiquinone-9 3-methyltransferase